MRPRGAPPQPPERSGGGVDWPSVLVSGAYAALLGVLGLLLLGQGVAATLAEYAGTPGEVRVTRCVPFDGKSEGWTCSGEFVADGGRFRLPQVTIEPFVEDRPSGPVRARVVGPDADEAWIPSLVPLTASGGGLAFLAVAGWVVRRAWRPDRREVQPPERARRRSERRGTGPAGPPEVGDRARSRRRRRRRDSRRAS